MTPNELFPVIRALGRSRMAAADVQTHADALAPAFEHFEINTPLRIAAALAQFAHETGGFRWLRELGGERYFQGYDGRRDLGNTQKGDGARFRGRGYIQITGRNNYFEAERVTGLPLINTPELVEQPATAAWISCWWWQQRGLNPVADAGEFRRMTRMINGGLNGLKDRENKYAAALALLNADAG